MTVTAGSADAEIGLFGPGVPQTGVNLLSGSPGGFGGPFPITIMVATVGTYTLAISDSRPNFSEAPFSYRLNVSADKPILPGSQVTSGGPETLILTEPVR